MHDARANHAQQTVEVKPAFVNVYEKLRGQPWGFVVYRVAGYDRPDAWAEFRRRLAGHHRPEVEA